MLSKKDLKLIGEFVDKGNPKEELNFALLISGAVFAADTRKVIKFNLPELKCEDMLAHKKMLKLIEGFIGKNNEVKIMSTGHVDIGHVSLSLNNANLDVFKDGEFIYPLESMLKAIDRSYSGHFQIDSLDNVLFELTQKYCFIEFVQLYPLVSHAGGDFYDVFFNPQSEESSGMVKIVAHRKDEELGDRQIYTVVIMGKNFKSEAKE